MDYQLPIPQILQRAIGANSDLAVLVTDANGHTTWANEAFRVHTGYGPDEYLGRKPGVLLQFEGTDPSTIEHLRQHIRAGQAVSATIQNRHKTGRTYWTRLQIVPVRDDRQQVTAFVGLQTDVTEEVARNQTEAEARNGLLSLFSHEIRTPLNALTNLVALLDDTPLSAPQQELLRYAGDASETLLRMVNEILDFARLSRPDQSVASHPVALDPLLDRVESVAKGYRWSNEVALQIYRDPFPLPAVMTDGDRLFRAILNLVGNALKFTDHGQVIIRVETETPHDSPGRCQVRVSVTDTGIGIAPEDQARVLKPFEQVSQGHARRYDGTGLGLALCNKLITDLGGELQIYSAVGEGSCFWFSFTADQAPVANAGPTASAATAQPLAGLRILVVDDNTMGRLVAQRQIQRLGAEVTVAESGPAALALLSTPDPVDVVLMDLQMPGMDGLETTRRLRTLPGRAHVPVLALSAAVVESDIAASLAVGMCGFIAKPFVASTLAHRVLAAVKDFPST